MIAFEVTINGRRLCCAGIADRGILTAILNWVRRRPEAVSSTAGPVEELRFSLGGLRSGVGGPGEHLTWYDDSVKIGDEIRVRIVEVAEADKPAKREPQDPNLDRRAGLAHYERLKKKYGE